MQSSLQSCFRVIQKNDAIILIEDAVITVMNKGHMDLIKNKLFVLEPDLKARGIKIDQITEGVSLVDYNEFVKLTVKYDNVQTWN